MLEIERLIGNEAFLGLLHAMCALAVDDLTPMNVARVVGSLTDLRDRPLHAVTSEDGTCVFAWASERDSTHLIWDHGKWH